jgi:hypothetical protein
MCFENKKGGGDVMNVNVKELLEKAARNLGCELKQLTNKGDVFTVNVPVGTSRTQLVFAIVVKGEEYIRFFSPYGTAAILNLEVAKSLLKDNFGMTGIAHAIVNMDLFDGQGNVPRLVVVGEQLIATAEVEEIVDKIKKVAEIADAFEDKITRGGDRL